METFEIYFESGKVVRVQGEDWAECQTKALALAPITKPEEIIFSDQYEPQKDDRGELDVVVDADGTRLVELGLVEAGATTNRFTEFVSKTSVQWAAAFAAGFAAGAAAVELAIR